MANVKGNLAEKIAKVGYGVVSTVTVVVASSFLAYSAYALFDTFHTNSAAFSSDELLKYKPEIISNSDEGNESNDELLLVIEDYSSWLTISDTNIDYPVVKGNDNLFYANHDVHKANSITGSLYLDSTNNINCSDSYNVIYGHSMDNGAMFGQLHRYREKTFCNGHNSGMWSTKSGLYDLSLFGVITTSAYESSIYDVGDRYREVVSFLDNISKGNLDPNTTINVYDTELAHDAKKILALSTCDTSGTNDRIVVLWSAVKRQKEEKATTSPPTNTATPEPTPVCTKESDTPTQTPSGTVEPESTPNGTATVAHTQDSGTTKNNLYSIRVTNTPATTSTPDISKHTLRISFILMDGSSITKDYVTQYSAGDKYKIAIPSIEGFSTPYDFIEGIMPSRDVDITVHYVSITSIDDQAQIQGVETFEKNPSMWVSTNLLLGFTIE